MAFVSLLRNPPESLPKEGVWLSLTFAGYFAVLAITTALNGPDPTRFIEFVIISPFVYFIPLALLLPVRCTDISLKGLGRAAMIGSVPTAFLALLFGEIFLEMGQPALAPGNPNVLAALLLLQVFLCLAGWLEISTRERRIALLCVLMGLLGLIFGVASRGAILSSFVLATVTLLFWINSQNRHVQRTALVTLFLALFVMVLLGVGFFYDTIIEVSAKVTAPEFGDWSTSAWIRVTLYRAALLAISDNPWIGLGLHLRFEGVAPYFVVQAPELGTYQYTHMHNLFLTHGTASGIPGMLAALSLFICILFISLRYAQPSIMIRWLGAICTAGLFSLGITETVLFHDLNTTFFLFLFVLVSIFSVQARGVPGQRTSGIDSKAV